MDYINSGTIHYTIPAQPLPLVDQDGKSISVAENWRLCHQDYLEACHENEREEKRRKAESRVKWQARLNYLLPCFGGIKVGK